jgi:branched-subunit amino acid transport protein
MSLWLIILGMTAVTFGIRLSVIAILGDANMPEILNRALRFVPPVALSAIIFPEVLMHGDSLDLSPGNARLVAGIIAALVAWKSRNTLLSIGAGMIVLWILQSLL